MNIALTICWSIRSSHQKRRGGSGRAPPEHRLLTGVDPVNEREPAAAIHLDDPNGLFDVMRARELELAERGLDVDGFHRGAELVAVAIQVGERQVGPLG